MDFRHQSSDQGLFSGLSIIHSNHLEDLRQVAVTWIKTHPLQVLETEQFIVQSNGMAQWLKLALAADDGCGISAGIEMRLPGRYVWSAYRAVLGSDTVPEESPYDRDRLMWRIFRLLPDVCSESVFEPLNRFLEHDKDQRKRSQLAGHLADLYDQYQVYRADWLEDWAQGADRLAGIAKHPVSLSDTQRWQAELWRRIKADVPEADRPLGRSDLHRRFLEKARSLNGRRPKELPPRVIVFGISSLPRQVLETVHAVSSLCQVLLFVHNPCRYFWADIVEGRDLLRIEHARHRSKATMPDSLDPERLHPHANPLLAAWGKQGRDYIGLLYGYDEPDTYDTIFPDIDLFRDVAVPGGENGLLQQVQQAILDLDPLPEDDREKQRMVSADESIRFHLAHSRRREVEILQDQLLHFFETLEDLRPRDIMVMTPDIESYAPHIEAVFGNLPVTDPRYIPFTIADKPTKESMPLLKAIDTLLHLPDSRMGVSEVMALLDVGAFRERFGIETADLPTLRRWIDGTGISWGFHGEQRTHFELPAGLAQNTWAFGLDRMLLGYAVGGGGEWNDIEPYEEVGGLDAALAGTLFDVIRQLERLWREMTRTGTPTAWCRRIRNLVRDCFVARESQDQLTLSRLDEALDQWLEACTQAMLDEDVTLTVVREYLLARMKESSISQRFLAGMVNFGTLMPMRAIPFRVVCLLGMNDGDFPRSRPPLDFDLMAGKGQYRPGDRSRREDDRYLFLEALLSARERMHISYVGRNDRDNSERMPSVLVGQFRDYLAAGWCLDGSTGRTGCTDLLDALTRVYPLQPFGKAYFLENRSGLFTYAHEWRSSLDTGRETCPGQDMAPPLDDPDTGESLNLGVLIRFFKNPVAYFFNQRLSVRFDDLSVAGQDQEPFALDSLASFGLGGQLLEAGRLAGHSDAPFAVAAEARRLTRTGDLPMAGFGQLAAQALSEPVMDMLTGHQALLDQWPRRCDPLEISLNVTADEMPLVVLDDWLDNVYEINTLDKPPEVTDLVRFARWEFYPLSVFAGRKVDRMHSLAGLWVTHLAGCAMGIQLVSHLVAPDGTVSLPPVASSPARKILTDMVLWGVRGLCRPLPVTAKTGLAYTRTLIAKDGDAAKAAASKAYQGDGFRFGGELAYDAYLQRAYPGFDALWQAGDNEFVSLCHTLYAPLVAALETGE